MSKLIVNVETNEIVERELNKAEKDQQKIDEANVTARKQAELAEEATRATAKAALLTQLGITAEQAKLLLS